MKRLIHMSKAFSLVLTVMLASQACVGKFLSTMLSTENAQFKLLEVVPVANTKILVSFNKPLNFEKGALVLSNYSIPGLNLMSVSKGPETHQVYLFLDPNDSVRMQRQYYTLTVSTIQNMYLDDLLPGAENRSKQFMGARWLRATCLDDAGTFTCPSSGTALAAPVTVTVRGDYARGQNYRWRLYNVTTSSDHFALSAITPVANTFTIPAGIPSADYRLDLMIQDDAGAWQPATDYTQYFFSVDNTSVSDIGLSNVPASLTSDLVTNISVVYRNCVEAGFPNGYAAPCYSASSPVSAQIPASYKFRIGTKAGSVPADCNGPASGYTFATDGTTNANGWSLTPRSTNLQIIKTLSGNQCYLIQVLAADSVGNFQCDASAAETTGGACANPVGPGIGSIADFFAAKSYQEARFLLDTAKPTAAFVSNTLPVSTTSATSFAVAVDSTDLAKYQYRVIGTGFSGTWSTDKNPGVGGDLISGAGLTNGGYTIDIVGKDAAGNYQLENLRTTFSFTVDTNAPTATIASQGNCTGAAGMTSAPDNGLPRNPTRFNCHNVVVSNVTFYKYAIVSGNSCPLDAVVDYSAQRTAATDFIAADNVAWTNGTEYSICVIGSNNGVLYQGTSASAVTRHTFRYDTTPPTSQVLTWISPATNLDTKSTVLTEVSVQIGKSGAENITGYKGTVVTGACPTSATMVADNATYPERSPETPLQATGLAAGTVRICFIGRDAAGNYEAATQSVTYTVFAPPAPNDGVAGIDDLFSNTFNYTWVTGAGIPTGTQEIRVRVCKDSACTEPLPGMNNGTLACNSVATCNATSSYTLNTACAGLSCIKQLNGATYYAQIKVKDSVGVESSFGASSSGKRIVGAVSGVVRDTNNNAISGATVKLYSDALCATTQIGADATSAGDGSFSLTLAGSYPIPIKLASSGYCIKVSTVGPVREGTKTYIEANAGATTNIGNVYAVNTSGRGCMIGSIVDGSNGSQLLLSNATFTLKDYANNTLASTPNLDPDGKQFAFPANCVSSWGAAPYNNPTYHHSGDPSCAGTPGNCLTSGVYSLQVAIPGYYTITESTIAVADSATTNLGYLPVVGTFATGSKQIKVILTWGNQTKDLDLHVVGPASNAFDCQPYNEAAIQNANGANSKFHVSFQQRYCAETGTAAPTGSTSLAVDDSFEYGPEIINFYDGYVDGTYKFSVYNNDATALNWNVSKARIDIYAGSHFTGGGGLIKTILSTGSSALRGWRPFRLTVAGTTLTVDDTTGVGYANYTYGTTVAGRTGTRTNGSPNLTVLSNAGLTTGMRVSGANIPANTVINAINVVNPPGRTGTTTNGNANITGLSSASGNLAVGMTVTGTGIPAGATITAVATNGTQITISANATANGTPALTFSSGYTLTMSANATQTGSTAVSFYFNCSATDINGPSDGMTNGATVSGTTPADPNLDCGLYLNGTTAAGGAGSLDW
ncbi:MAG: hypothetical protein JNJ69_00120 [Leptospiraceae bacterium]|nr:hypothetical protein [Leptospiraceae bacterium]